MKTDEARMMMRIPIEGSAAFTKLRRLNPNITDAAIRAFLDRNPRMLAKKPCIYRHGNGWACTIAGTIVGYGRNASGAYKAWAALCRGVAAHEGR